MTDTVMDFLANRMANSDRVSQEQEALCEFILYLDDSRSIEQQIQEISLRIEQKHPDIDLNDGECESGYFALSIAALQGLAGVCQELLDRGADVNKATSTRGLNEGETALFAAVQSKSAHAEQVLAVLCAHGADLEHVANGTTALGACSWQKNNHMYRALVIAGANVDVRPLIGRDPTLLLAAIRNAKPETMDSALELVRFLCEKGRASFEILTRESESAYELAASLGHRSIVKYLATRQSDQGWRISKSKAENNRRHDSHFVRPGPIRRGHQHAIRHEPYTRGGMDEITEQLIRFSLSGML